MSGEFGRRVDEWRTDLESAIVGVYPDDAPVVVSRLLDRAEDAHQQRPDGLVDRDRLRAITPHWYQDPERIGYMAYVDRFGGSLRGVGDRIPYLVELGVDTLHLLSLLAPRAGESDGGYAIRDYRRPDPRLGSLDDLQTLIDGLHAEDITLCVDYVLNHTSDDHEWALAAAGGSEYHRSLYRVFPDREEPDRWEATLPEVFPTIAPGNFTWNDDMQRWVWTTFREFQWDLDWSNPDVMIEMFDIAAHLANLGVDILRLDAIAFTWKRLGTNCQNQPEAHLIAQALRAALAMAAPATILLAEAIVAPDDLVGYLGRHDRVRRECELGYHNQLMVQGWSMLASKRADMTRHAMSRLPATPDRATWFTYVRCHDDIGWAIDDADAGSVGLSGAGHREFLAAFYRGDFWQSFARGTPFGTNPETNDERTSGMTSTLAGVAAALAAGDDDALDRAIDRIVLLYGIAFGYGGIPIIYMGDELCQGDDETYLAEPALARDSRWTHRPCFDDELARLRDDVDTPTGRVWAAIQRLVAVRRACGPLHEFGATVTPFDAGSPAVFAWHRRHPRFGEMVGLANVGDTEAYAVQHPALANDARDLLAPDAPDPWHLAPLQVRWVSADADYGPQPRPPTAS